MTKEKPIRLWYIHLTPKKQRDEEQIQRDIEMLARGPGKTDAEMILWVAKAMSGIEDSRDDKWVTKRQKPIAFTDRRDAVIESEKHENEYWKASVREIRVE